MVTLNHPAGKKQGNLSGNAGYNGGSFSPQGRVSFHLRFKKATVIAKGRTTVPKAIRSYIPNRRALFKVKSLRRIV